MYDLEDRVYVLITSARNENVWYADRVGTKFPLSRTNKDWDHVKVSLTGAESMVYHGDYDIVKVLPSPPPPSVIPRKTKYYVGDMCVWERESVEIPDRIDVLRDILYLSNNGMGDVTRYEVILSQS